MVLSNSEIRVAERATVAGVLETSDGPVRVRPGDFIVTMPQGERFPILAPIYFGTYEVLSNVGNWFVGRRLLHPRRAWPIESAGAELDYGQGRGWVSGVRGDWIYQSDDADYGLINAEAKSQAYVAVGKASELDNAERAVQRFNRFTSAVALLPPVLTGLALLALHWHDAYPAVAEALLIAEVLLLVLGVWGAWHMRTRRWSLRVAIVSADAIARRFQVAAQAAGVAASELFPMMSLWRAAQGEIDATPMLTQDRITTLKSLIDESYQHILHDLERHHRLERRADLLSWLAVAVVLFCLGMVAMAHQQPYKLLAIWLPSVVGAAHAWTWRRQSLGRVNAASEMLKELRFIKARLVSVHSGASVQGTQAAAESDALAAVRMLCHTIARYSQRELRFTAAETAGIPV